MIHEVIITTVDVNHNPHIAPMGIRYEDNHIIVSPFKPSATLDNLLKTNNAVVNFIDDVSVFAGIVTGEKKNWDLNYQNDFSVPYIKHTNTYTNIEVISYKEDEIRPNIICKVISEKICKPFKGFNRAQFSVIESAVLSTRLGMISDDKVIKEIEYLKIGIDKTAGRREKEAWGWIMKKIESYMENK